MQGKFMETDRLREEIYDQVAKGNSAAAKMAGLILKCELQRYRQRHQGRVEQMIQRGQT